MQLLSAASHYMYLKSMHCLVQLLYPLKNTPGQSEGIPRPPRALRRRHRRTLLSVQLLLFFTP